MAEVQPFRGIRYRLDQPEDAAVVVAPPYDVISPADQQALEERDARNVIRLELPRDEDGDDATRNRYTRAAELFRSWLEEGVLVREDAPAFYVYGQRYRVGDTEQERLGLMAALKVEPYEAGVVLPHEQTFPKHKEDRFRLLSTAKAQFSPIFGLYSAPEADVRGHLEAAASGAPVASAVDREGVEHRMWAVTDPTFTVWADGAFAGKQVFIADGHHRYETAMRYAQERRAQAPEAPASPFDFVMTFLVEMDDPGLVLLPTHRLVPAGLPSAEEVLTRLEPYFRIEDTTLEAVDALEHHQIGLVLSNGRAWKLTLTDTEAVNRLDQVHSAAWRDLDVVLLHRLVLESALGLDEHAEIVYTRDPAEARNRVTSGEFQASFVLPSPRVEELKEVAGAGDKMPHKSTYFWPKAISGLVIYEE
ncbi:MAG: hypothetical protein K0Q72_1316 [Armatimonadetes bacterium]|jgi:uncharacterized protein (DUF1015 family)|nr:hypothetical protein [Armatimonadota bacterium]